MEEIEPGADEQCDDRGDPSAAFIARLRALDDNAWAELYDRHNLQIWRYAYGRTGSRDAADEVAAEAFTEALSSIQRYHYRGRPIIAWLYTIARNVASKQLRRARRDVASGYLEPSVDPMEGRLDSLVLADALDRLTADQREVIALRFVAGYSTREIAAMMRKQESAIYSLEARAIGALRRQLAKIAPDFAFAADENRPLPGIDKVR